MADRTLNIKLAAAAAGALVVLGVAAIACGSSTKLGAAAASDLDHLRGEVARDQAAALAEDRGRLESGLASTSAEL